MLPAYPEEDQEDVQERFKYHLLEAAKTDPTCYGPIGAKLHPPDEWVDLEGVKSAIEY